MDRKEVFAMFVSAAPSILEINTEKGFWKDKDSRNKDEMVMLIVSELGECLEAHRKNISFPLTVRGQIESKEKATAMLNRPMIGWNDLFIRICKDTLEDEMADVIIRSLDYVAGWKIDMKRNPVSWVPSKNFREGLYSLLKALTRAHECEGESDFFRDSSWSNFIQRCIIFCDVHSIDILTHVKWKLDYNKTRPHLHGKTY